MLYRVAIEIFATYNWLTLRVTVVDSEEEVQKTRNRFIRYMKQMKKHNSVQGRRLRLVTDPIPI